MLSLYLRNRVHIILHFFLLFNIFITIFSFVEEKLNLQWRIGNGEGGLISTNIGVVIIIRITDNIIDHLKEKNRLNPINNSSTEIANQTFKYLDCIITYISTLDHQKIKQIKSMGTSAAGIENLIRELQKRINEKYNDFNPKGLDQWLKDNSGEFNEDSKSLTEKLEYAIRENILEIPSK